MSSRDITFSEGKKELLRLLLKEKEAYAARRQTIQPRHGTGNPPLSYAQQRLWFLDQLRPNNPFYNMPVGLHIRGPLKLDVLARSLNEIVRRHESLRTTFHVVEDEPVQVIAPRLLIPLPVEDLRGWPESERIEEALRRANQDALTPFDLQKGPLLRATVLHMDEQEYVLLLTMHHIVADGWSLGVFNRELMQFYTAFARGESSPLPELSLQYADFAVWQREWLQGEVFAEVRDYWQQHLHGAEMLHLPTDHPRPAMQTFQGEKYTFALSPSLTTRLRELSRREGTTMFMTLLSAFLILLQRYSSQDDIVIGTPIANRTRVELEPLIGFFINMLALRTDLSGQPTVRQLLQRVREVALGAYAHQDMPFERLVELLQPERDLSHEPLFQIMFVVQNTPGSSAPEATDDELVIHPLRVQSQSAKFDLTLSFGDSEQELSGFLEYNTDLFEAESIERLARHLQTILEGMVATPDCSITLLPMLTLAEQQQLLVEWNATQVPFAGPHLLHQLFEEQAARTPQALALHSEQEALTYRQLNERANQLAHYLRSLGVGPDIAVGLALPPCSDAAVALLAILKAGGAYMPLDSSLPDERLAFILSESAVSVLLTQQHLLDRWQPFAEQVPQQLCLDRDRHLYADLPTSNPAVALHPDHLAYSIYTSGSTGRPKGVLVSHRAICNRVLWAQRHIPLSLADRVLQLASWSFDIALWELFGPWLAGAEVILAPPGTAQDMRALLTLIQQRQVTVLHVVPSLLQILLEESELATCRSLRCLLCGGEALSAESLRRFQACLPIPVHHFYGPTEAAISDTCWSVEPEQEVSQVSIGRPIANTQVYLLDAALQPVPVGVPGELYIGGTGLARGYQQQPDLTADRFVPDPFGTQPGARLYRTGDMARYLPSGELLFLGRQDHQVKIRGHRIELGEIETVLIQHEAVNAAVVLAREDTPGEPRLVAYVVPETGFSPTGGQLRAHLQQQLPDYMLPAVFVPLKALPLSPNGKIDRMNLGALPAPEAANFEREETLIPPRDALEWQLLRIFEEVLNIHPIGVTDNFFALGGHSLSAVQLMSRIEKQTGQNLPLSTLFQGATVEYLASVLRQQTTSHSQSPVVPIQPNGAKPPFFCVHPVGGEVFCYVDLARHLGPNQPVYGLQAIDAGEASPARLEAMAASYIKALRAVQSHGPYLLGGWSFGGLVAFEMARQLQEQGDQVALLALLDPPMPGIASVADQTEVDDAQIVSQFVRDLQGRSGGTLPIWSEDRLRSLDADERLHYVLDIARRVKLVPDDAGLAQVQRLLHVFKHNTEAMLTYVPQTYAGNIALFRASEQAAYGPQGPQSSQDPAAGWRDLAQGIETHMVPGNHYSFLQEPFVQTLAEQLHTCLNEALAGEKYEESI